jgi:hypothetical protein
LKFGDLDRASVFGGEYPHRWSKERRMSDDPMDNLLIRTIALEEILQHLIVKIAQASSSASRQWIADLEQEIENTRELVLAAGDANTEHRALAGHVAMEVKRIFKSFVE